MRGAVFAFWAMIRMAFRSHPGEAAWATVVTVLFSLNYTLFALWSKLLVDSLLSQDFTQSAIVIAVMAAQMPGAIFMALSLMTSRIRLQERVRGLVDRELMELSLSVPQIEHFEREEYLNQVEIVRSSKPALARAVSTFVANIGLLTQMLGSGILLAALHPVLLLLPLLGLPSLFLSGRGERIWQTTLERTAPRWRLARHLFELSLSRACSKEIRVYSLGEEILRRHGTLLSQIDREVNIASIKQNILSGLGWLLFTLGYVSAIAFVVWQAMEGEASPGDVLLTVALCVQINNQVAGVVSWSRWFLSAIKITERYLWLVDYAARARERLIGSLKPPTSLSRGIELSDVSFRYPGTDALVLNRVSLFLPAGKVVGLVGENGAGKTTMVKLLLRLYEPNAGRISVDGTDIRDIELDQWRESLAACFQDFCRFEFTAQESIGVGDLSSLESVAAVKSAVVKSGATSTLNVLPHGLRTQLGASWDSGVDLSEGQWQEVALARGMMRSTPILLVLDEPTASLDPASEYLLFERFARASRQASQNRGITIFVSHRFSTVSLADLIVVLEGGQILEVGSHEELIAKNGLYAELFRVQAKAFQ